MHSSMQNIKFVLFDFDDTLVNTISTKWAQHKHVAQVCYGIQLRDDDIARLWGRPLREYLASIFETDDIEAAINNNAVHEARFPKTLFDASIDVLDALKHNNLFVGIVTANGIKNLEHDMRVVGISKDMFDYIQTEEDTIYHKPDGRVFDPVCDLLADLNIPPEEVLYIGDALHDYRAATEAGFKFLGVETGLVDAKGFSQSGASSVPHIAHILTPYPEAIQET